MLVSHTCPDFAGPSSNVSVLSLYVLVNLE
jgi:hypothetical protein